MLHHTAPARTTTLHADVLGPVSVAKIGTGTAFHPDYVVIEGTAKRDRIRQLGNAANPPAARRQLRVVTASLASSGGRR